METNSPGNGGPDQPPSEAFAGAVYGTNGHHLNTRIKNELILVSVRIKGRSVIALVDSGATHNFIGSGLCERSKFKLIDGNVANIELANGARQKSAGVLKNASIIVGASNVVQDFVAMPMRGEEFEVILGKPWLTSVNPDINWAENVISIGNNKVKGVYTPGHFDFQVCSLKSMRKAVGQQGTRIWSILVRETEYAPGTPYSPSLESPNWGPVYEK